MQEVRGWGLARANAKVIAEQGQEISLVIIQ